MTLTNQQGKELETSLIEKGYKKYSQNFKNADFIYWKNFDKDKNKQGGYSVGFSFYDWSAYPQYNLEKTIGVSLSFLLGNNQRVDSMDLSISDDKITIQQFEDFCAEFYKFFINQKIITNEEKEN